MHLTQLEITNPSTYALKIYTQAKRAANQAPEFTERWQDERPIGVINPRIPERIILQPGRRIVLEASDDNALIRIQAAGYSVYVRGEPLLANGNAHVTLNTKEQVSLSAVDETSVTAFNSGTAPVRIIQQHIVRVAAVSGAVNEWGNPAESSAVAGGAKAKISLHDRSRCVIETASPDTVELVFANTSSRDLRAATLLPDGKIERGEIIHPACNAVVQVSARRGAVLEQLPT